MRRVVVVVLDGMRRDRLGEETTPHLARFAGRATSFAGYRSMFPSATRVVSASFATGCYPARHGLQGNSLALLENGRLVHHDAGEPDFLQHRRRITGQSLAVPTLAERLRDHGGMILFSNVSPGAAYAHDPDGHGHVYHRAGSFAPGRLPIEGAGALSIGQDAVGEQLMTERFINEVLFERRPALAILWMGEPDATQHKRPLGSPEHLAVLRQADANAARVIEAVDRLRDAGDDVLLIVASDHGQQTVSRVIDIEAELVAAGLKAGLQSDDVITPTSGTENHPRLPSAPRSAAPAPASSGRGIAVAADQPGSRPVALPA
jgi:predicted AlkP superfamily pyrophosphatase or phosphodiesterase